MMVKKLLLSLCIPLGAMEQPKTEILANEEARNDLFKNAAELAEGALYHDCADQSLIQIAQNADLALYYSQSDKEYWIDSLTNPDSVKKMLPKGNIVGVVLSPDAAWCAIADYYAESGECVVTLYNSNDLSKGREVLHTENQFKELSFSTTSKSLWINTVGAVYKALCSSEDKPETVLAFGKFLPYAKSMRMFPLSDKCILICTSNGISVQSKNGDTWQTGTSKWLENDGMYSFEIGHTSFYQSFLAVLRSKSPEIRIFQVGESGDLISKPRKITRALEHSPYAQVCRSVAFSPCGTRLALLIGTYVPSTHEYPIDSPQILEIYDCLGGITLLSQTVTYARMLTDTIKWHGGNAPYLQSSATAYYPTPTLAFLYKAVKHERAKKKSGNDNSKDIQ